MSKIPETYIFTFKQRAILSASSFVIALLGKPDWPRCKTEAKTSIASPINRLALIWPLASEATASAKRKANLVKVPARAAPTKKSPSNKNFLSGGLSRSSLTPPVSVEAVLPAKTIIIILARLIF